MVSWLSIVYFIGIIQGILLFFALYFRKNNSRANRALAILIMLMTFILLNGYFNRIHLYIRLPHLLLVTFPLPFLYGPIMIGYVRLLTKALLFWEKKHLWHLLPAVAVAVYFGPFYFKPGYQKLFALAELNKSLDLLTVGMIVSGLVYSANAYLGLRRYQKSLFHFYSDISKINLSWIRILLFVSLLLWSLLSCEFILDGDLIFTYMGITFFIYIIGYFALRQPEISGFRFPESESRGNSQKMAKRISGKSPYEKCATTEKWEEVLTWMNHRKTYMEPSLTLPELAEQLSTTPHFLSYLINRRGGCNFFHFINGFRVEEVKRNLTDFRSQRKDLLEIAFEAGFSTKATFNAIFKKHTGMTPSQYRDSIEK